MTAALPPSHGVDTAGYVDRPRLLPMPVDSRNTPSSVFACQYSPPPPPPPPVVVHHHLPPPHHDPMIAQLDQIESRLRQLEQEEAARALDRARQLAIRKHEDEEFRRVTENAELEEEVCTII